ncbi:MAG: hypothetical protein WCN95_02485 [bacterium]
MTWCADGSADCAIAASGVLHRMLDRAENPKRVSSLLTTRNSAPRREYEAAALPRTIGFRRPADPASLHDRTGHTVCKIIARRLITHVLLPRTRPAGRRIMVTRLIMQPRDQPSTMPRLRTLRIRSVTNIRRIRRFIHSRLPRRLPLYRQ